VDGGEEVCEVGQLGARDMQHVQDKRPRASQTREEVDWAGRKVEDAYIALAEANREVELDQERRRRKWESADKWQRKKPHPVGGPIRSTLKSISGGKAKKALLNRDLQHGNCASFSKACKRSLDWIELVPYNRYLFLYLDGLEKIKRLEGTSKCLPEEFAKDFEIVEAGRDSLYSSMPADLPRACIEVGENPRVRGVDGQLWRQ